MDSSKLAALEKVAPPIGADTTVEQEFLIVFANIDKLLEFRIPELHSVAELGGFSLAQNEDDLGRIKESPYLRVKVRNYGGTPEEAMDFLCSRCTMIKTVVDLWAIGTDYSSLKDNLVVSAQRPRLDAYGAPEVSWKMLVDCFGRSLTREDQMERIARMEEKRVPVRGPVKMKDPDVVFYVFEELEETEDGDTSKENKPAKLSRVFYGRLIGHGQRGLAHQYRLTKRKYLSTTSMDPQLSLLLANQGHARAGMICLDPFCGTGSILVGCAHFGAFTMGGDIDWKVCYGHADTRYGNKPIPGVEGPLANFRQYGFPEAEIVRCSNERPVWRKGVRLFDAIVCDPPYGIRAGSRKSGLKEGNTIPMTRVEEGDQMVMVPSTQPQDVADTIKDLVKFAARELALNGRLVFWLPTTHEFTDEELPQHPCFVHISNSEQKLTKLVSRRLITMKKISLDNEDAEVTVPSADPTYKSKTFRAMYLKPQSTSKNS